MPSVVLSEWPEPDVEYLYDKVKTFTVRVRFSTRRLKIAAAFLGAQLMLYRVLSCLIPGHLLIPFFRWTEKKLCPPMIVEVD